MFYKFLKNTLEKRNLFIISSEEYMSVQNIYKEIYLLDGSIINLGYFNNKKKKIETKTYCKRRVSITVMSTDNVHNDKKTKGAYLPNLIHSIDAQYSRNIIKKIKYIVPIHDSFGVPPHKLLELIIHCNNDINKNPLLNNKSTTGDNFFSIFILI
jgi:hypothetical protein